MTKLEEKLQVLEELSKKILLSDILDKKDVRDMDKKVSSVLKKVESEKQYFRRLS